MKLLILALCFCLAVAESSNLMNDLEKLLSSDSSESNPPDIDILKKLDELDALNEDALSEDALSEDAKEVRSSVTSGGKYGYCGDGYTLADGPNMKGCARKLCYDAKPGQCIRDLEHLSKTERKQKCYKDYYHYRERCSYSCGFCKQPSPGLDCRRRYGDRAKYGCCWDGMPALTSDKRDCMACRDITPHTCKQFYNNMFGQKCGTNSYRIRSFLFTRCPRLCGRCQCK